MPNIQLLDGKKIPFDEKINGFDLIKKNKQISREKSSNHGSRWKSKRFKL